MSQSLLKRSIALVEEDLSDTKRKKNAFSAPSHSSKRTNGSLFDIMPEQQKLIGKYKNRRGNEVRYEKIQHSEKLTVDDLRKMSEQRKSKAEENLQKLLRLGSKKMDSKITDKLMGHVKRKQLRNEEEEQPKEEVSIFTEEDFKAFEREYFAS